MGAQAGRGLIPVFPGGHRGCRWTRAPRSATALSASQASWLHPGPYCSDRRRDSSRRCSVLAGRPDARAQLPGFPLPKLILSLLLASDASTTVALRAGGPMLKLASLDRGKEEVASCRASRSPEVSGAVTWRGSAARLHPACSRRGLRHCSESNTAPTLVRPAPISCRRPGRQTCCRRGTREGEPCTPRSWPRSESSE